ncbi:uncharacterized protein LOC106011741 [Aplysia californica]|uniref:Uncharacterized protein LOC106011741 n=1 Tax=Aplysia californica TaxID=6500 RepID=A0ABM0ZZP0_APLCA|nr:uncharacterized protein LOC106011741 [Aplysia californica]
MTGKNIKQRVNNSVSRFKSDVYQERSRESSEFVVSVESYFWKGLGGPTLGDVLNQQFITTVKTSRSTQTNWRWRKMAERWGHARLIEPTEGRSTYESPTLDLDEFDSEQDIRDEDENAEVEAEDGEHMEKKEKAYDDDAVSEAAEGQEDSVTGQDTKQRSRMETIPRKHGSHGSHIKKHEVPAFDVEYCRPWDKCVDTSDLEFDPFDPNIRYTRKDSNVKPMYIPSQLKDEVEQLADDVWVKKASFSDYNRSGHHNSFL